MRLAAALLLLSATPALCQAPAPTPPPDPEGIKQHDLVREQPVLVTPGAAPAAAPSDAIVLFDGKDLKAWRCQGKD